MTARWSHYLRFGLGVAMLVGAVASMPAAAEPASPWTGFEEAQVRLISAQTATGEAAALDFGLQFKVNEGWKTYWRYPGEAGAAPRMDWSGSENVSALAVDWPAPRRFSAFGFDNFGYKDNYVLPVSVTPQTPGQPVVLALKLDYLVCSDICVPGEAALRLTLAEGAAGSSEFAMKIAEFRRQVPKRGADSPFSIQASTLEGSPGQEILHLQVSAADAFAAPDLLVEVALPLSLGRPDVALSDDRRLADVRLKVFDGGSGKSLAGQPLRLTLIDGERAGEHALRLQP